MIKAIRELFGIQSSEESSNEVPMTDTVKSLVEHLGTLEPSEARFVAAFSYILSRVAYTDNGFEESEKDKIVEIVDNIAHLGSATCYLLVDLAAEKTN